MNTAASIEEDIVEIDDTSEAEARETDTTDKNVESKIQA